MFRSKGGGCVCVWVCVYTTIVKLICMVLINVLSKGAENKTHPEEGSRQRQAGHRQVGRQRERDRERERERERERWMGGYSQKNGQRRRRREKAT